MNPRHQDRASINPHGVFVFKPLGTGLGLEVAHEVRHAPGLWSSASGRRQGSRAKIPAFQQTAQPGIQLAREIPVSLMGWQRFIALWCDAAVCAGVVVFALLSAGFFLAVGEESPDSVNAAMDLLGGLSWLRHAVQVAAVAASAPWWALLAAFCAVFGGYRLMTGLLAGRSPGEALVAVAVSPGGVAKAR